MQPTLPPWPGWPGWGKREGYEHGPRLTFTLEGLRNLHDLNINWSKFARPDLAPYNPNIIRHLISFDPERRGNLVIPTIPANWRIPYRELNGGPWVVPEPPPPPRTSSSWTPSGELVGALILLVVIALFLLRAGEKCLTFCTRRRRRSEEWPCASVLATQHNLSQIEDIEGAFSSQPSPVDLPPPYSECTPANKPHEEPPPPYSACYSAVGPTVHIRRESNKPTSSNTREAHGSTANNDDGKDERRDTRENRTEDSAQDVSFRVIREGDVGRVHIV